MTFLVGVKLLSNIIIMISQRKRNVVTLSQQSKWRHHLEQTANFDYKIADTNAHNSNNTHTPPKPRPGRPPPTTLFPSLQSVHAKDCFDLNLNSLKSPSKTTS